MAVELQQTDVGVLVAQWPGTVGGPPGEQKLWKPLRDNENAARMWKESEELAGVTFT